MQLSEVQNFYENGNVLWSTHCIERMQERDITRADIKNCIMQGEIIENYPNDFPHPSCLIFGYTVDNKVIHVVVGCDGTQIWIITVYIPNTDKFLDDLKTRREC
ncbi:MAG: DUF4258 domain-containing protein [Lachnospiraceae bacterium]|nr:DUF4258 domain-containing protein [Lachnospiraceae bacterium]